MKIIKVSNFDLEWEEPIYINVSHIVTIDRLTDDEEIGAEIRLTDGRIIFTKEKAKEIYDMIKKAENLA